MKRKNKIIFIIVSILIIISISLGLTYAYFNGRVKGNPKLTTIKSDELLLTFDGGSSINVAKIYPGRNITKTFTIKNTGSVPINYDLAWHKINSSFINNELVYEVDCKSYSTYVSSGNASNVLAGTCEDNNNQEMPIPNGTKNIDIVNNDIPVNYTHEYTLTLKYLQYNNMSYQNTEANFSADIYVSNDAIYETSFKDKILADKASMLVDNPVTTPGVQISGADEANLVRQEVTTGNYTYYFRGNVTNNYVFFGGFYWRIIRINEDGSIRMMYAGTTNNATGAALTLPATKLVDFQTGGNAYPCDITYASYMTADPANKTYHESVYNNFTTGVVTIQKATQVYMSADDLSTPENEAYTFNSSTGYYTLNNPSLYYIDSSTFPANNRMYTCYSNIESTLTNTCTRIYEILTTDMNGSNYRVATGNIRSSSFTNSVTEAESNQKDSKIKIILDNWYQNNLVDYSALLADPGFCSSRRKNPSTSNAFGSNRYYYYNYYEAAYDNYVKTLQCMSSNDLYTVTNSSGNKKLTYPVGLITAYELLLAGNKYSTPNSNTYTATSRLIPTMSPAFEYANAFQYIVILSASNAMSHTGINNFFYPRPVINVKGNLYVTGTGTAIDPYVIDYE